MADKISLSIITADGTAFEQPVTYIHIPTDGGSIGVLPGHAPTLCSVDSGIVTCTLEDGSRTKIRVSRGVANISGKTAMLLVSEAETVKN